MQTTVSDARIANLPAEHVSHNRPQVHDVVAAIDANEVAWDEHDQLVATHVRPAQLRRTIRNLCFEQRALVEQMERAGFTGPDTEAAVVALLVVEEQLSALLRS